MDKRYQVFVSSTYADLKEERQQVLQTLMEMDCIPSGMELFPAADEEQWEFIKKVINDCDYYLLIIGGRYGSTTDDGISYTEKEYDYAVEKGIKIIAFLHKNPKEIAVSKSDTDPDRSIRLRQFRDKVATGRLVKFWGNANELPGLVALSLTKTIKTHPAIGWVRANNVASTETLLEINELRKENEKLRLEVQSNTNSNSVVIENLANLEETIELKFSFINYERINEWNTHISWKEIFACISPYLIDDPTNGLVKSAIETKFISEGGLEHFSSSFRLNDQVFQTIKIQFFALGLITGQCDDSETRVNPIHVFWKLTEKGKSLMVQLRTIQKS